MIYLLGLTVAMCLAYVVLGFLFTMFFRNERPRPDHLSLASVGYIAAASLLSYLVAFSVSDPALGNRLLHVLGGGFLAFFVCFLVVRDGRLAIGRLRFFVFSFLVVMALGVANEMLEYVLQNYAGFLFAADPNDTWLDLMCNVAGALIGGACFTPLVRAPR